MGIIVNVLEVKGNSDSVATDEQVITDAATSAVPAIIIGDSSIVVIPETTKAEPVHVEENGTAISGAAEPLLKLLCFQKIFRPPPTTIN